MVNFKLHPAPPPKCTLCTNEDISILKSLLEWVSREGVDNTLLNYLTYRGGKLMKPILVHRRVVYFNFFIFRAKGLPIYKNGIKLWPRIEVRYQIIDGDILSIRHKELTGTESFDFQMISQGK